MDLVKILMWHELLPLGLGVYFGVVLQKFFESLVSSIVIPAFELIIPKSFFSTLDYGNLDLSDFIGTTINLLIGCIILYYVVKVLKWRNGDKK